MSLWQNMSEQISQAVGRNYVITERQSVGGGCINQTWRISDGEQDWFVKLNDQKHGDMFEAEAAGLAEMASSQTIRVPVPLCTGSADGHCFLVMEWLPMGGVPVWNNWVDSWRLCTGTAQRSSAGIGTIR